MNLFNGIFAFEVVTAIPPLAGEAGGFLFEVSCLRFEVGSWFLFGSWILDLGSSFRVSKFGFPIPDLCLASALFLSKYSSRSFFNCFLSCRNSSLIAALLFLFPNLSKGEVLFFILVITILQQ